MDMRKSTPQNHLKHEGGCHVLVWNLFHFPSLHTEEPPRASTASSNLAELMLKSDCFCTDDLGQTVQTWSGPGSFSDITAYDHSAQFNTEQTSEVVQQKYVSANNTRKMQLIMRFVLMWLAMLAMLCK